MVTVVGRKHSGKTTTVVRLADELTRRGRRVMTIKHGSHTFNIDPATTDTYRHFHEGHAERVAMVAPETFALVMHWGDDGHELGPETIAARYMADADVVLCEGFKASSLPRIEVYRRTAHPDPLYDSASPTAAHYIAMLTDDPTYVAPPPIQVFRLTDDDWLPRLADLIERDIMGTNPTRAGAAR